MGHSERDPAARERRAWNASMTRRTVGCASESPET
jgi:hypothetical protein